ncbi:hypothetical protein HZB89_00505 [archaeon]|nr:hypothetical protein [archaeon]
MAEVTLQAIYSEMQELHKDIEIVKYTLLPKEKLSIKELSELKKIQAEMKAGKEKSFKDTFTK